MKRFFLKLRSQPLPITIPCTQVHS